MPDLKEALSRPLNYACVYDEPKHRIVAVPRTQHPGRHVFFTLVFVLATFVLAGAARIGTKALLESMLAEGHYPWWATALDSTASALVLVFMFLSLAPRLGMFPGIRGGRLELTQSDPDKKLAILIKKNPRRLNVDWFKDWYTGTASEQEKMYVQMRDALEATKSKKTPKSGSKKKV